MGCQSIAGLPPALNSSVPIYTPEWREALQELCLAQGLAFLGIPFTFPMAIVDEQGTFLKKLI